MTVPGMNLLRAASKLIKFQDATLFAFKSNTTGADGVDTASYHTPVPIKVSLQPVPQSLLVELGLDLSKNYIMAYTSTPMRDVRRDAAPDMISFNGRKWKNESNTDWQNQDGWQGSLCVDIGPA